MKSVLSLFSGIGGLCHHGISAAGLSHKFRVQQFVEISPYSQSQLRHEQPGIPIHADITNYRCHQGQFDILCGGFPCSGTSNAGDKKGLDDPRSGLWHEMFRIIHQCRPAIALIENPTGLLSRGMATVLEDLSKIRYVCEWETIPAYCLGLPHERERVFIIAYADGLFYRQQPTPWTDQIRNQITQVRLSHEDRSFEPGIREVAFGIPVGVAKGIKGNYDARRAYGLSCSPRQAAIAWKRIDYLCSLLAHNEA